MFKTEGEEVSKVVMVLSNPSTGARTRVPGGKLTSNTQVEVEVSEGQLHIKDSSAVQKTLEKIQAAPSRKTTLTSDAVLLRTARMRKFEAEGSVSLKEKPLQELKVPYNPPSVWGLFLPKYKSFWRAVRITLSLGWYHIKMLNS